MHEKIQGAHTMLKPQKMFAHVPTAKNRGLLIKYVSTVDFIMGGL
jgi:hypothetical protein